jgi:hypothetical protein
MQRDATARPLTLHALLVQAQAAYAGEIPALQHSMSLTDDGGAPAMSGPARSYLGLAGRKCRGRQSPDKATRTMHAECADGCLLEPDNFRSAAFRVDEDGRYRTPTLAAIESIPDGTRRMFVRWLLTNTFRPTDVSRAFGIPDWCAADVMHRSLTELRRNYRAAPLTRNWISGRSDAQRAAEEAA